LNKNEKAMCLEKINKIKIKICLKNENTQKKQNETLKA